jgi:hypothetical protein
MARSKQRQNKLSRFFNFRGVCFAFSSSLTCSVQSKHLKRISLAVVRPRATVDARGDDLHSVGRLSSAPSAGYLRAVKFRLFRRRPHCLAKLWEQLPAVLARKAQSKLRSLDASHIKASNRAGNRQDFVIAGGQGGLHAKISTCVDGPKRSVR